MGNPDCPHCGGVSPSTDGRTECGWCVQFTDHVPSVVPRVHTTGTPTTVRIFDLVWDRADDGYVIDEPCTELDEDLWDEDGLHPWDGLLWGYDLTTHQTWAQTLETPAEYETVGRLWVTDSSGSVVDEVDAREFQ